MAAASHSLRPDADELDASSLVDNSYRIVRLIGRGGMGSVYEAEDIRLGRSVALKVLRSDLAKALQADERFMQEAKILARIRSPFVATVYSVGATEAGRTYIAMEYIDGESLGDLLDRERWLPLQRGVRIAQRCCEALMEAHKLGIIHRDLKPDNVLLTRIGSVEDYVKVVDLGLAKHVHPAGNTFNPRLTQARLVVGTPAYMSPEQAAGQEVGLPSDLYSLGVILYEMITGYLPVDGESPQDFLRAHQLQAPLSVNQRRQDLVFPPVVDAFFKKVLAKAPGDRPQDARAFARELEKFEGISAESRTTRQTAPAHGARTPRKHASSVAPTIDLLEERLDRAKDRVRLEVIGVVSCTRAMLYETIDTFVGQVAERADAPVVMRIRVPPPGRRLPLACLFEEIRIRAGLFDDDAPSAARRKLLGWVQALMPDRPDRASQVAHLIGLFLRVEFPDSPHLSHARAVPEVARMAGGAALVDALRGIAGRSTLVLILERSDHFSETETVFLRRLVRQLGATPVLLIGAWVSRGDDVPAGLAGLFLPGSVARVPAKDALQFDRLLDAPARRALATVVRLGAPVWPDLLEAALGVPAAPSLARLMAAGAVRSMPASRLASQVEYSLGDFPDAVAAESEQVEIDYVRVLAWIHAQAVVRPELWVGRLSTIEAQAGDLVMAGAHARQAAELMRGLGALPEALQQFEVARQHALDLRTAGKMTEGAIGLAEAASSLASCLAERGDHEAAADRTREAIEALRQLPGLREEDWYRLGVPLLAAWATSETACGRAAGAVPPLETQVTLLLKSQLPRAAEQLPFVRLALGKALGATSNVRKGLEVWTAALNSLPAQPLPTLSAELSMRIADAYRTLGDGDRAVAHARKALAAARDARNLVVEVEALRALALALRDIGELDDAEAQLGEALNALGRLDRQRLAAEISVLLADILQARGAVDEADAALAKACRAFAALPDLVGLSDALRRRGEIQMAHGIYTRAQAFAEEAARQGQLASHVPLRIKALLLAARACAAGGDSKPAHTVMEEAFSLVAPDVPTVERADCMVVLADLLEAAVLTSDRMPRSLLEEAKDIYLQVDATPEAERIGRRLRAM
ncbi:MAG: serine/threonine protein kinase [Myxococcales bacterium]|nr:serine/threonine protein kinase [Myxococcales bacterium]